MSTQPLLQRTAKKVFFANERTFLSWLHVATVLGGLAVGLLNFGDKTGKIAAAMYTLIAIGVMLYALFTFHHRARSIELRNNATFGDRWGPTVLALLMTLAIAINFIMQLTKG